MPRLRPSAIAALAALGLMTCGQLDTFTVREDATTTIEQRSVLESVIGNLTFGEFANLDLSQSSELKNQGVDKDDIDAVYLSSLQLDITAPTSGQDFTFIESIRFYVEAPGQERRLLASGGGFPPGATTVNLDVEDVNLKPYASADSMQIGTEVTGQRPENETTVKATLELKVDVNVSGALCGE